MAGEHGAKEASDLARVGANENSSKQASLSNGHSMKNLDPQLEGPEAGWLSQFCSPCQDDCQMPKMDSKTVILEDGTEAEEQESTILTGPFGKLQRTGATMALGAKLHFSYKYLKANLEKEPDLSPNEIEERWNEVHRDNVKQVFNHVMKYRGFFIKVGQKCSTMKGLLPEPWIDGLEPLQDHVPISPFHAVQSTVLEDLGQPLHKIFIDFESRPIASASIGQAHIAHLNMKHETVKVCVKVQHPGVAAVAFVDLQNLEVLLKLLASTADDAPDFSEVLEEMKANLLNEVDFRYEAKAATDAQRALIQSNLNVVCPEPFMAYSSARVMTMRFIEGWKITEVERLPLDTDREALATQIVEAWALLVFQEGLIHGDPHPGNILVEKIGEGPNGVRPVLLDWGMSKRITAEQKLALAKWVVAGLSRDRFEYMESLRTLGVEFTDSIDLRALDFFMFAGMIALRDTVPSSSMRQFNDEFRQHGEKVGKKKKEKQKRQGKDVQKFIGKIPGWTQLFGRGLELLQDVCGMLEVSVPMARSILKYALPLVRNDLSHASGLPAQLAPKCGVALSLEDALRAKLHSMTDGHDFGLQVAVLRGTGDWLCSLATGRLSLAGAPVLKSSLLPLLNAGQGVMVACLLSALSRPTVTGKQIDLDTPVERLWPEFSRAGKSGRTIGELLQHCAGLGKPYRNNTTHKMFCSEQHMEKMVASSPYNKSSSIDGLCQAMCVAISALLRRATGTRTSSEALKYILKPFGLHEDISYAGSSDRLAHTCHPMLTEVTMGTIWESFERKQRMFENEDDKLNEWLTWRELGMTRQGGWCTDPLLVNFKDLQTGKGCLVGRGLRATAEAVCRLFASDAVSESLLMQSCANSHRLCVESLEEWESVNRCLDMGMGWQLFRFKHLDGSGGEVIGYGHADGATGSITMCVQGVSIAVLVASVDNDTRHVGHELLTVIAAHLGLAPVWHNDVPNVPERVPAVGEYEQEDNQEAELAKMQGTLERLEAQVSQLTQALVSAGHGVPRDSAEVQPSSLSGVWHSAETNGLDAFFDALQLPTVMRAMAKRMQVTLNIDAVGDRINMSVAISVAGRQMNKSSISFVVGTPFEGDQMGGKKFQGIARWEDSNERGAAINLVVNKTFNVTTDLDITLEEHYEITEAGRMLMRNVVLGKGKVDVFLQTTADRDRLCSCLDNDQLVLRKDVTICGKKVWRMGRLVGPSPLATRADFAGMKVPGPVTLQYDDLESTTIYDREGGPPQLFHPQASPSDNLATRNMQGQSPKWRVPPTSVGQSPRCCGSLRSALFSCFAEPIILLGRALEGASTPHFNLAVDKVDKSPNGSFVRQTSERSFVRQTSERSFVRQTSERSLENRHSSDSLESLQSSVRLARRLSLNGRVEWTCAD